MPDTSSTYTTAHCWCETRAGQPAKGAGGRPAAGDAGTPGHRPGRDPRDGDRQAFTALVRDESGLTVYTATLTFAGLWVGDIPIPDADDDPLD